MKSASFSRAKYANDWKIKHASYERTQYRNFKNALGTQTKSVSKYIKLHGTARLAEHLSILVSEQPIKIAYKRCYEDVGMSQAAFVYKYINKIAHGKSSFEFEVKQDPVSFFSEKWRKLMQLFFNTKAGDRITGVTETTRDQITELLAESVDLPLSERATFIEDKLNDPDFNRMRALRIARTESTTAANFGAFLGADSSDYITGKIWIPILDMNTRPDHADMDGKPAIELNDVFEVGSSLMLYPGDMSAPANQVINCRCSLAIVPLLSESGIPILKRLISAI